MLWISLSLHKSGSSMPDGVWDQLEGGANLLYVASVARNATLELVALLSLLARFWILHS